MSKHPEHKEDTIPPKPPRKPKELQLIICPTCKGRGTDMDNNPCPTCEGEGEIDKEV